MANITNIPPVRLRVTTEQSIGTTAFFRNRPLVRLILEEMKKLGRKHYNILFHACSIGAEVNSFVISYLTGGYFNLFSINIDATDLEPEFIEYSRNGVYPSSILSGMSKNEAGLFKTKGEQVTVKNKVKDVITFIDACNYLEFDTQKHYHIVFLLNTLIYVPEEMQSMAIDSISNYNDDYLVTTAFHMETIKSDLCRNRYTPVTKDLKNIHDAWTDRRVNSVTDEKRPGIYANWSLPEYSEIPDFEYKYCSIFKKQKDS